jgi:hypothetical protein
MDVKEWMDKHGAAPLPPVPGDTKSGHEVISNPSLYPG